MGPGTKRLGNVVTVLGLAVCEYDFSRLGLVKSQMTRNMRLVSSFLGAIRLHCTQSYVVFTLKPIQSHSTQ